MFDASKLSPFCQIPEGPTTSKVLIVYHISWFDLIQINIGKQLRTRKQINIIALLHLATRHSRMNMITRVISCWCMHIPIANFSLSFHFFLTRTFLPNNFIWDRLYLDSCQIISTSNHRTRKLRIISLPPLPN